MTPAAIPRAVVTVARTGSVAIILALGVAGALCGWGVGQAAPYMSALRQPYPCECAVRVTYPPQWLGSPVATDGQ